MNPSASSQHSTDDRPTPAATYVLLELEYAQGRQHPHSHLRHAAFTDALTDWTDVDRTNFWYDLAVLANRDPRLEPTPGLCLTPEVFAREVGRIGKLIDSDTTERRDAGGDPHSEDCKRPDWYSDPDCEPQGWLRFTNPIVWSLNGAELGRYLAALTVHLRSP